MLLLYAVGTVANLFVAMLLALLIERPFMKLRVLLGRHSWSWAYGTAPPQLSALAELPPAEGRPPPPPS
jgi:hypothetical protein